MLQQESPFDIPAIAGIRASDCCDSWQTDVPCAKLHFTSQTDEIEESERTITVNKLVSVACMRMSLLSTFGVIDARRWEKRQPDPVAVGHRGIVAETWGQ